MVRHSSTIYIWRKAYDALIYLLLLMRVSLLADNVIEKLSIFRINSNTIETIQRRNDHIHYISIFCIF